MKRQKAALLKAEKESNLEQDEVLNEKDCKHLEVNEKLKDFKLTTKYAQKDALLNCSKLSKSKKHSVVKIYRNDNTQEQVDPLSLKEIILQSDNIKKITIEKIGIEDAKRVSFHFDHPNLEDKSEKVVIKGESLKKLIDKRSDENKSKLKKNISRRSEQRKELACNKSDALNNPVQTKKRELKLVKNSFKGFKKFAEVGNYYESQSEGLKIKFPVNLFYKNLKSEVLEYDLERLHNFAQESEDTFDDLMASELIDKIESSSIYKENQIRESEVSKKTKEATEDKEEEAASFHIQSAEKLSKETFDCNESSLNDHNIRSANSRHESLNVVRLKDHKKNEKEIEEAISDDSYLENIILDQNQLASQSEPPVLKTIKYKAQILSKHKNSSHNGYYYQAVNHVELFNTGASYLEDFKEGVRSFAFSGIGVDRSKQKSIFGICSFFNYHTEVKSLIVASDFKTSFFSNYLKNLKSKDKSIYENGISYQYFQGEGFDILDFQELRKIYTKIPHFDYEEFLRELSNQYDLIFWDLPELSILDANKEVYFPVIRMLDNVSLVIKSKGSNVYEIQNLIAYYSKYQVAVKGVLFDAQSKKQVQSLEKKGAA